MRSLGKRISIIGSGAAVGKSTLAANLAEKLGYPVVHLDQLHHYPDGSWVARPRDEFIALLNKALAEDAWVMEGSYTRSMPQRFERSDTIIHIEMKNNRVITLWRAFRRHSQDRKGIVPRVGGIQNPSDQFSWKMVYWILAPKLFNSSQREKSRIRKRLLEQHAYKVITLRSFTEIDQFLQQVHHPAG